MSARQAITDAIYTALDGSTGINYVSRTNDPWWKWGSTRYPGVLVMDGDEEKIRLAYPHATADDMESRYTIEIKGYTERLNTTSRTDEQRTSLADYIESAIVGSTAVSDLVEDITPVLIETDDNGLDAAGKLHGIVTCTFEAWYFYNHNTP